MNPVERAAEALQSDPPKVLGIMDGGKMRPLVAWNGSGAKKSYTFDLVGTLLYSEAIKRYRNLVLKEGTG